MAFVGKKIYGQSKQDSCVFCGDNARSENNQGFVTCNSCKDKVMEDNLMKASHINHPSNLWVRESKTNYKWLYSLWINLLKEYTHRYGREHACEGYINFLKDFTDEALKVKAL